MEVLEELVVAMNPNIVNIYIKKIRIVLAKIWFKIINIWMVFMETRTHLSLKETNWHETQELRVQYKVCTD